MMEFFNSQHPKARKPYTCELCGKQIQAGESYHRFSGKYDGSMFDLKYCRNCEMVIDAYCSETGECEYDEDAIAEWLHEKYCTTCTKYIQDDCMECEITCPAVLDQLKKLKGGSENE